MIDLHRLRLKKPYRFEACQIWSAIAFDSVPMDNLRKPAWSSTINKSGFFTMGFMILNMLLK